MIVRNRGSPVLEMKLIMIFIDPWKDIDFSEPFDLPENIFIVKNSNVFLPRSADKPNMYSIDKIRAVHLLPATNFKHKVVTLIV